MADTALKEQRGLVDVSTPSSEPFRTLRLALQLRSETTSGNIFVITSPKAAEGKSTVASNFALVSSLSQSSLLIDADLRRPRAHEVFGLDRAPGVVEALAQDSDPAAFIQTIRGRAGELDILTAGRPLPQVADLTSSARMAELLQWASHEYSLVVVDSPPVLSSADAAGIAGHPGVSVVLVASKAGRRRALRQAVRKLELVEAKIAGLVVNREGRLSVYGY